MRMKIVVTREGVGEIEIPLSKSETSDLLDILYMVSFDCQKWLELNKIKAPLKKFEFLVHDVVNEGKVYGINKKGKFKLIKKPRYLVAKPKWM